MRLKENTINLPYMRFTPHQQQDIDRRIMEVFGEDQCLQWKNENPEFLRYQCFELEFGFAIEEQNKIEKEGHAMEKLESFDPVNFPEDEIELISLGVFNPMRYNVRRSYISRKYYSIGHTGKVLMLYSGEELRKLFNANVA